MNLKIILSLLIIGFLLSNNASAFLPLTPGTIIIENHFNSTKQGTYNVTQANNANVNSGGFKLNFINGTNNPVSIVNSPAKNQVNITISSTGVGGGVTTLNALAGALNIVCISGNTTCTSGGTSITVNTAWNVVLTGGSTQTITKGLILNALTLGGDVAGNNKNILSLNNLNSTKVFQNGNQVIDTISSGTGISVSGSGNSRTVTSTVVDTNTAQIKNADGATIGLFGTRTNATQNTIKTLSKTGCITLSDNGTNILIGCTTGGVNSLNFTTSSDFDFNLLPRNMSMISLDGTVFNFKLKPNVVLTNESGQTITKALTLNSAILGGDMNVGSNALTNSGHKSTLPLTTGQILQANGSASSLTDNVRGITAGTGISINGSTGTVQVSATSSGGPTVLAANVTSSSTTAFTHVWNIPLTANSGNAISGVLVASSNTAGAAVQVGANMSSTSGGSGSCTFHYGSTATAEVFFTSLLGLTSSDSAWTVWLSGANQAAPITFTCAVQTGSSAPTLQINFQAEVASTVAIKAGSYYTKTP